jgi:hypothetical protein
MYRKLSAIELAEGALLADIAVIFQLLSIYLPVVGKFFGPFVTIVFTVLVLRRNLYTAILSVFVALFLIGILTGSHFIVITFFSAIGGVFLGWTMKRRMHHIPILLLGVTGDAIGHYLVTLLLMLLIGLPLKDVVLFLHNSYHSIASLFAFTTLHLGLGNWWQHSAYPPLKPFAQLTLTYWWLGLLISYWFIYWPIVTSLYLATNIFVSLLGHDVRPFFSRKWQALLLGPNYARPVAPKQAQQEDTKKEEAPV